MSDPWNPHPFLNLTSLSQPHFPFTTSLASPARSRQLWRYIVPRVDLLAYNHGMQVADFGMARRLDGVGAEEYYKSAKGAAVPVRWTAPEALEERKFTEKSDVWSFGILCYEVFTSAALPYSGMNNEVVLLRVRGGFRLPCPEGCPPDVFSTHISACWARDPQSRPSFSDLERGLASVGGSKRSLHKAATKSTGTLRPSELNPKAPQAPQPSARPGSGQSSCSVAAWSGEYLKVGGPPANETPSLGASAAASMDDGFGFHREYVDFTDSPSFQLPRWKNMPLDGSYEVDT